MVRVSGEKCELPLPRLAPCFPHLPRGGGWRARADGTIDEGDIQKFSYIERFFVIWARGGVTQGGVRGTQEAGNESEGVGHNESENWHPKDTSRPQ